MLNRKSFLSLLSFPQASPQDVRSFPVRVLRMFARLPIPNSDLRFFRPTMSVIFLRPEIMTRFVTMFRLQTQAYSHHNNCDVSPVMFLTGEMFTGLIN